MVIMGSTMKSLFIAFFLALMTFGVFAQSSGVIKELTGTVELKHSGSAVYVAAAAGAQVAQDTIISTGFKSTALIEVGSTLIAVRPLTRLTLSEIRSIQGTETLNINLQAGRVRIEVKPPAGTKTSMSVNSPVATASVRGTVFEFDTRNIIVKEGVVDFIGNYGYMIHVRAGTYSGIEHHIAMPALGYSETGHVPPPVPGYDPEAAPTGGTGRARTKAEAPPAPQPPIDNSPPSGGGGTPVTPGLVDGTPIQWQ